jgi:predicted DNA-binding protein (UPF0278 family)
MGNDILTHRLGWFDWNTQEDFLERIGPETIVDISNWPFKKTPNNFTLDCVTPNSFIEFIERL